MARKPKPRLKPMRDLNTRQQNERRFARRIGFKDEVAYRAWVKRQSSLPESDPRYFRTSLRGNAREAEIKRLRRIIKKTLSPAKEIRRKADVLIYDLDKMSAFAFRDRYLDQIKYLLRDKDTSDYDRRILRNLLRKLNSEAGEMPPPDEGMLF